MKILQAVTILTVSVVIASSALAGNKRYDARTKMCRQLDSVELEWESRPWGKGGKGFEESCKKCHTRDNDSGGGFLYAESKSQKGWNRVFAKRRVRCATRGSWEGISEEKLAYIMISTNDVKKP